MSGRELYDLWLEELAKQNCSADSFDDLDPLNQEAWDGLANRLAVTP